VGNIAKFLGQRDLAGISAEHVEQDRLEAVVGTSRVARSRPDALIFLADQLLVRQMLIGIAPQALADFGVKDFREALREAIGKCLQQDVRIVVMGFLERSRCGSSP
jgi:hypothetical protein